jgi:beta-phosphoglucomutase-like phosphatase (HAD superfamily)
VIDAVLRHASLDDLFEVTVSSEEVARGKPAPDVYLETARRLGTEPRECAAVEDSANGIRSARAAGMRVVAIPNRRYPPAPDALAEAHTVLSSIDELTVEVVYELSR